VCAPPDVATVAGQPSRTARHARTARLIRARCGSPHQQRACSESMPTPHISVADRVAGSIPRFSGACCTCVRVFQG
jgi:hypothetical protein